MIFRLTFGALVTHVPFRAEGGAKRVFALAVYGKVFGAPMYGATFTHVPFRAEGGAKRVFALAVYGNKREPTIVT